MCKVYLKIFYAHMRFMNTGHLQILYTHKYATRHHKNIQNHIYNDFFTHIVKHATNNIELNVSLAIVGSNVQQLIKL